MNKPFGIFISALTLGIVLAGCGISPYRQQAMFMFTGFGGYYDSKLPSGNYHVSYSTGHLAFYNREMVRDFALRRACELAIEKGFEKFQLCSDRGNEYGCSLEIHLTNSRGADTIDARATLYALQHKYKDRSNKSSRPTGNGSTISTPIALP